MKRFNLKEYLKNPSRKVVTGNGKNVRILCTDAKSGYNRPILTLVEESNGSESIVSYTEEGQFYSNTYTLTEDLFFAPEKHEGWVSLYKNLEGFIMLSRIYQTKEEAEKRGSAYDCYVATAKIEWEE